jgi:hypothetical protein
MLSLILVICREGEKLERLCSSAREDQVQLGNHKPVYHVV